MCQRQPFAWARRAEADVQSSCLMGTQEESLPRLGVDVERVLAPAKVMRAALATGALEYSADLPGGMRLGLRGQSFKIASVAALQNVLLLPLIPRPAAPRRRRGAARRR
jgi:hypothetical protein